MAILSILNQVVGPLPVSATFNAPSDGPACLVLAGSVWCAAAGQTIGITLELDGKPIGSATIFSNGASTHRAVVPSYIPVTLPFGPHKVTVIAENSHTVSDVNDRFDVVLMY
ncbi:MAG TPA: hypothetical protein VGN17_26985 [Bryobacteraceae bacterium]|jgi:hypothetical protein